MNEPRRIEAALWADNLNGEEWQGYRVMAEPERTDTNEVAIHTFIDGRGSEVSLYFDRESAIDFATALLEQCRIGVPVA